VANSRVTRGRQSEALVAEYLRSHGWPDAERIAASLPGADIRNTGDVSIEVKARRGLDLPGWLKQTASREGLPVLVVRPDGYGEARMDMWAMVIPFGEGVELLRKAGYECAGESNGSPGGTGV
jgi:hypothetical protein